MPLEVTSEPPAVPAVVPLAAEEVLVAGVVVGAVVLEMVELMAMLVPFQLAGLSACCIDTEARDVPVREYLSQVVDEQTGGADAARQGRELVDRKLAEDGAVRWVDLLDQLFGGIHPKFVRTSGIVEIFVQLIRQCLRVSSTGGSDFRGRRRGRCRCSRRLAGWRQRLAAA